MTNLRRHLARLVTAVRRHALSRREDGLVAVEYGIIVAAFGGAIVLLFLISDDLIVLFDAIADSIAS